ncbi:interferon phi 4 [Halichoeres trimaculatus]|uniref:interferon a3-like n=1 Tax=Halichoeres trimaculatus TaxID=147232 RepID=UPI003D9ED4EF
MLCRILSVCVLVCVFSAGSALSCRWMDHKFREFSKNSLDLLDTMASNSTNSTEDAEGRLTVAFPHELYSQASQAAAADKVSFTVQILDETMSLFRQNHSSASWEEKTVDNFLGVVSRQADGLRSCIQSHGHKKQNKKLNVSFRRLRNVLQQKGQGAEVWELIRKEVKSHLIEADQLISSLLTPN